MTNFSSTAATSVRKSGEPVSLVLYMFEGCPFCRRVEVEAERLNIALATRDIRRDPAALEELMRVGKKRTVPCLFIDGQPRYESNDIVQFLREEVRSAT